MAFEITLLSILGKDHFKISSQILVAISHNPNICFEGNAFSDDPKHIWPLPLYSSHTLFDL